jgi:glycosyltransferase involved in cell wall biosynthesis
MTQPKPNVLMVTTGYPRHQGDVFGCFIADTAEAIVRHGDANVTVLAPHAPGFPWRENLNGVHVVRCPYFFAHGQVAYGGGIPTNIKRWSCRLQLPFFLIAMAVWTLIVARRYDVIHAHWGVSGWLAWPAAKLWKKTLMVSYHGSDLHGSGIIFKLSKAMAQRADTNICVTKEQGLRLEQNHAVISYGIDLERFKPMVRPTKPDFVFCYVGYLIPLKRVDRLISAMTELPAHAKLMIYGDGPCRGTLEAQVKEHGLSDRITFHGSKPYHLIHDVFQQADAHVLVSEREGRPNVILQAMACGIPSCASAVGGIPEQILHEQTGLLCVPELTNLVENMTTLCDDVDRTKQLGLAAHERIRSMGISTDDIAKRQMKQVFLIT